MIKNLKTIILSLTLIMCFQLSARAEQPIWIDLDDNPYKEMSSDECIEDVNCSWFYFQNIVLHNPDLEKNSYNIWKTPIVVGYESAFEREDIENFYLKSWYKIKIYTGLDIETKQSAPNHVNIFLDGFEKELSEPLKAYMKRYADELGFLEEKQFYEAIDLAIKKNLSCVSIDFTDRGRIFTTFIFVDASKDFENCYRARLLASMGLNKYSNVLNRFFPTEDNTFSNMELFLLTILYTKNLHYFKAEDMDRARFRSIHRTAKKRFYEFYETDEVRKAEL